MYGYVLQGRNRWRNRRSQRLDKMEILNLQSSLQSEIQAKQQICEELTKSKASQVATEKYVFCYIIIFLSIKMYFLH